MAGMFDEKSARRIASAVRRVEDASRSEVKRPSAPRVDRIAKWGISTTTITARSGKTPGSGSVQPYTYNGTVMASTGSPVSVLNLSGTAVGANVWVKYQDCDGSLFLDGQDCSGAAP